jgi:hypothetical protein
VELEKVAPQLTEDVRFDELHRLGSLNFGWSWLDANEVCIAAAQAIGIYADGPMHKRLLSAIAYAFLATGWKKGDGNGA